jgi:hypothetical protein
MSRDPREAEAARRRVLDPYLNRLREWNHRIPAMTGERAASVLIGKSKLRVESAERLVIENWKPERAAPSADARLVMDSLSLMIKLLTELEQSAGPPGVSARVGAEVVVSVALGEAILKQLQVLARESGTTLWPGLKSRMEEVLERGRSYLDGSGKERIRALSSVFDVQAQRRPPVPPPVPVGPVVSTGPVEPVAPAEPERSPFSLSIIDELDPELAATAASLIDRDDDEDLELPAEPKALVEPPSRFSRRTRGALLLCGFSLLLWTAVVRLPGMLRGETTHADLSSVEGLPWVERAVFRASSLYVDVDPQAWKALSHGERWQAMKQLVAGGSHSGARGMLVRGTDDRALAQWIEGRGIVLDDEPQVDLRRVTDSKADARDRRAPSRKNPEYPEIPASEAQPQDP